MYNYNYNRLKGLIREHFDTYQNFAEHLGIGYTSLLERLGNKVVFKQDEIERSIYLLEQSPEDIKDIFYVKNTENRKDNKKDEREE